MNREDVKKRVLALMNDKGYFGDEATEDSTLDDLVWDSMDFAEMQVLIENEFFISPKDAEWENTRSVSDWIDLVMKYVKVD